MLTKLEEIDQFKAHFPAKYIETCNEHMLQVILKKTRFRKLRLRLQFPAKYPEEAVLIEISSDVLCSVVVNRMIKQTDKHVEELCRTSQPQVMDVVAMIEKSLNENKFLYAFDEIKYIRSIASKWDDFKMNQSRGTIRVTFRMENFFFQATFKLDDNYPDSGVQIIEGKSNFHENLVFVHVAQAREIVRRCTVGYTAEQALLVSNPIKKPINSKDKKQEIRLTSQHVNSLKGDVRFLKKSTDLREVNSKHAPGTNKHAYSTNTRKFARRELKSLSKDEMAKDMELESLANTMDEIESQYSSLSDKATKSLRPAFDFLWNRFVVRLCCEPCLACPKPLLPKDPTLASQLINTKDINRPERIYCGHWMHFGCLDNWMMNPPFGKICKICDLPIHHPAYSSDIKKLEKKWAYKQNKERELSEVADCFELSEEFTK